MPLPQVYLPKNRRDAWMLLAMTEPDIDVLAGRRAQPAQGPSASPMATSRSGSGPTRPDPLYFGFSHPDLLKSSGKPPVAASDLAGGTWTSSSPSPATLDIALQSPPDAAGPSPFGKGFFNLSRSSRARPMPCRSWKWQPRGSRLAGEAGNLAPGAYNLNFQTIPREDSTPPGMPRHGSASSMIGVRSS